MKSSGAGSKPAPAGEMLNHLIQTYIISNQERIVARYNENKNKTTIIEREKGKKKEKSIRKGLILVKLQTNNGKINLSY